jgi:YHS domain-containing protein
MATQVDPICGMTVDEERAAARSEYEGRTYYFCGAGCRERFTEDPWRYAIRHEPRVQQDVDSTRGVSTSGSDCKRSLERVAAPIEA